MAANTWVVQSATGEFRFGGFYEVAAPDGEHEVVTLPTEQMPNPRLQKWSNGAVVAKSVQEIASYDAAQKTAAFAATSRQKDILAMCALVVRARGINAWSNMSLAQKKTATLAEADVWAGIRQFIEDNI